MKLDKVLFDQLQEEAMLSPRQRQHYDLRTSSSDTSQRILNAMTPNTVVPIHRHCDTSETVIVCRGSVREEFYNEQGEKIAEFILEAGSECPALQIPKGMFHTCICLVPGTVIFEAKDGAYDPSLTEELSYNE